MRADTAPAGSEEAADVEKHGGRIDHIAYEAEDLEKEFAQAKEEGMDIIEGIVEVPEFWETDSSIFWCTGPEVKRWSIAKCCKIKVSEGWEVY